MEKLREEIIESEKARADLLKWKLIGVAALGATGLGLTEHEGVPGASLLLALIPPVCFYVDLLCRHVSLRIMVIGRYLRLYDATQQPYEAFVQRARDMRNYWGAPVSAFVLEDWALEWSTYLTCALVLVAGLVWQPTGKEGLTLVVFGHPLGFAELTRYAFLGSGIGFAFLTLMIRLTFGERDRLLGNLT